MPSITTVFITMLLTLTHTIHRFFVKTDKIKKAIIVPETEILTRAFRFFFG